MLTWMRRSTMWLLIAGFWLIDAAIMLYRHRKSEAAAALAAVIAFSLIAWAYRRVESKRQPHRHQ